MLPLLALAACSPEEPGRSVRSADAAACLEPPAGAVPTESDGGAIAFVVEGEATGDGYLDGETFSHGIRCEEVVRVFTVTDAEGGEWRVGYGWSEGGTDETPAMDLQPLSPVTLTFRDHELDVGSGSIGEASGFVVREVGRLAAVLEVGASGPALDDADLPDVVVGEAEVTGYAPGGECGRKVARSLRFEAETSTTVEAVGYDVVNVEGQQMTVWALASWGWEESSCPDVSGELSWALWREP